MPEGDTVHLAGDRMQQALAGRELTKTDFRVPRLATVDLAGRTVENVTARGKHLLTRISGDLTLHTHFKMEGAWHLYGHGDRWRGPGHEVRAVLETADAVAVGFRLPVLELIARTEEHRIVGHLGPDPLGDDWDPGRAAEALRADPERPIGDALLDQRVMAGPGNIYRCEICFLAGVHPQTPAGDVDAAKIVSLTKRLMEANRKTGKQVTTGDARPGRSQWVYGRRDQPCYRCGTPIVREGPAHPGGRPTYWCSHCQPLRNPVQVHSAAKGPSRR